MNPAVVLALLSGFAVPQTQALKVGIVITHSLTVPSGSLLQGGAPGKQGLVTIRGKNITVDFKGAKLRGTRDMIHARETLEGIGLLIDGCENVVVKNASIQGFRFNIQVANSKNVRIEGCDVSNSRAIRMMRNGEPVDTFLVLRDSNVWRGYGAGIWLEKSIGSRVEKCKGSGGTIGTALVDCQDCVVHNNDFSFCGGWGVAMARTKASTISYNLLDFDNRVWAGGWGGDSAALGMADNCDENYIVGNSMTHGGDGFFLSNRNDVGPVDPATGYLTPEGGSDHNVIASNDGSWSPANAFEGTFSEGNVYYRNRAIDCNYGFWLGFSNNSLVLENEISKSLSEGIAIEQGKGTKISGNRIFDSRGAAIHLWAGSQKERTSFPSTAIDLYGNTLQGSGWAYRLEGSTDVASTRNNVAGPKISDYVFAPREAANATKAFTTTPQFRRVLAIWKTRPANFQYQADSKYPHGLQWVQPDEYGPRDFRGHVAAYRMVDPGTVEIWPLEPHPVVTVPSWAVVQPGTEPSTITITSKEPGEVGEEKPLDIVLRTGGKSQEKISTTLNTTLWSVKWFAWKGIAYDDSDAWRRLFAGTPLRTESARQLGQTVGSRPPATGVPNDHYALAATTPVRLQGAMYTFRTLSDDGIRLFVDGNLLIDRWNHHGPTPDQKQIVLSTGVHEIRVEYCQEDGAAALRVGWKKS